MRGTPASRTHVEVVKDVSNLASKTHMVVVGALSNAWSFLGQGRYSDFTSTVFRSAGKNMQNNAKQIQQKLLCETFASRSCTSAAACRASDCVAVSTLSQYDLRILRELWTCRALYTNLYLYIPVTLYIFIPWYTMSAAFIYCFYMLFRSFQDCGYCVFQVPTWSFPQLSCSRFSQRTWRYVAFHCTSYDLWSHPLGKAWTVHSISDKYHRRCKKQQGTDKIKSNLA